MGLPFKADLQGLRTRRVRLAIAEVKNTMSQSLKILVADDHAMVLEMFEHFLTNLPDLEAVTAPDLDAALAVIDEEGPFDLVLDALGVRSPLSSAPVNKLPYGALWATLPEDEPGKPVPLLLHSQNSRIV